MNQHCLECNLDLKRDINSSAKHYFCSIECACLSGCYNIKTGMNILKLKEIIKNKKED